MQQGPGGVAFPDPGTRTPEPGRKPPVQPNPAGLLGTGYDEQMLAALVMVTRPASEVTDLDEAAEWVGMPEYDEGGTQYKLIVSFDTPEARVAFITEHGIHITAKLGATVWSTRFPFIPEDASSVRFEEAELKR